MFSSSSLSSSRRAAATGAAAPAAAAVVPPPVPQQRRPAAPTRQPLAAATPTLAARRLSNAAACCSGRAAALAPGPWRRGSAGAGGRPSVAAAAGKRGRPKKGAGAGGVEPEEDLMEDILYRSEAPEGDDVDGDDEGGVRPADQGPGAGGGGSGAGSGRAAARACLWRLCAGGAGCARCRRSWRGRLPAAAPAQPSRRHAGGQSHQPRPYAPSRAALLAPPTQTPCSSHPPAPPLGPFLLFPPQLEAFDRFTAEEAGFPGAGAAAGEEEGEDEGEEEDWDAALDAFDEAQDAKVGGGWAAGRGRGRVAGLGAGGGRDWRGAGWGHEAQLGAALGGAAGCRLCYALQAL
jgi:hypothetical protein